MIAEGEVKFTATLLWRDGEGIVHSERHVGLDPRTPTTAAYRRARSMLLSGQAVAFTTRHTERRYA